MYLDARSLFRTCFPHYADPSFRETVRLLSACHIFAILYLIQKISVARLLLETRFCAAPWHIGRLTILRWHALSSAPVGFRGFHRFIVSRSDLIDDSSLHLVFIRSSPFEVNLIITHFSGQFIHSDSS